MKSKTEKRFEGKKSVKTHQARNGKTVGQAIDETGIQPAAMSAILDKAEFESEATQKFREWLDAVEDDNDGNVELKMGVTLSPIHWMQLAAIAHTNEWTIECAIMFVLEHGLEDWGPSNQRWDDLHATCLRAAEKTAMAKGGAR